MTRIRRISASVLLLPNTAWVMAGFFVTYIAFFVGPVFFNSGDRMLFPEYVPANNIGDDLLTTLHYCTAWFFHGLTPYVGTYAYPPLTSVLVIPLLFLNFTTAYRLITGITLLCYLFYALLIPFWISRGKRVSSILMLVFVTGLLSYGLQFEIERGQFNVIAMFLCLSAIYIFHYHHKYRYLAYLFFVVSVQLKLFPAVLVIMFVSDWRAWKHNIARIGGLAASNILALFILGPQIFLDFLRAVHTQMFQGHVWVANHSIRSYVGLQAASPHSLLPLDRLNPTGVQILLFSIVGACLVLLILHAYKGNATGLDPYLLLGCTIASLLIPGASHDYKLPLVSGPMAILLMSLAREKGFRTRTLLVPLLLVASVAYSTTLFSFTTKPGFVQNALPPLMVLLVASTSLSYLVGNEGSKETVR